MTQTSLLSNYSFIIDGMTWSYSRIKTFQMCKYKFYLVYIEQLAKERQFFSEFGTLMHNLIEERLKGTMSDVEATGLYIRAFEELPEAPSEKIRQGYFDGGFDYFTQSSSPLPDNKMEIVDVEKKFKIDIHGYPFIGYIDCVAKDDDGLVVIDHKSKNYKRTAKPDSRANQELASSFDQLYVYAEAVKELYGEYPAKLALHSFRIGKLFEEDFDEKRKDKVLRGLADSIETIRHCESFEPDLDFWRCKHLCDVNEHCEHWQAGGV